MWESACLLPSISTPGKSPSRLEMAQRRLRRPRRSFEIAISLNFLYTVTSALLTTFGVYWLGRDEALLYFKVMNLYEVIYIAQSTLSAVVLVACIDLMYKRRSSLACHYLWLALVPTAQTLDHAAFWYVSITTFMISGGDRQYRSTLYEPLNGWRSISGSRPRATVAYMPRVATHEERTAVLIVGSLLHGAWCAVGWYLWALVYRHGSKLDKRHAEREEREEAHRRQGTEPEYVPRKMVRPKLATLET